MSSLLDGTIYKLGVQYILFKFNLVSLSVDVKPLACYRLPLGDRSFTYKLKIADIICLATASLHATHTLKCKWLEREKCCSCILIKKIAGTIIDLACFWSLVLLYSRYSRLSVTQSIISPWLRRRRYSRWRDCMR